MLDFANILASHLANARVEDDMVEFVGLKVALSRPLGAADEGAGAEEDGVDLLQSSARRLRVEDEDNQHEGKVAHGEEQIAPPAQIAHD